MSTTSQLREYGISESLVRLSLADYDSAVFQFRCSPIHGMSDSERFRNGKAYLWMCCDSIVYADRTDSGISFYELDVEDPSDVTLISRSETGLLYWLFTHLIEDQDWDDADSAMRALSAAAKETGFELLQEACEFQSEHGADVEFVELLLEKTRNVG